MAESKAVLFKEARRVRSFEDIVSQIQEAVLNGHISEGDRLPSERELCGIFGVSRSTLREGLRWLEALGVIDIRPGSQGGIFATRPSGVQAGAALESLMQFQGATARDLEEFRASFEAETAYWAALRAEKEDIETISRIVEEVQSAAETAGLPWSVLSELDIQFHVAVARTSKNQVRVAIMLGVHAALQRASLSLEPIASSEVRISIGKELEGIAEAIDQGNARLAKSRMKRHVERFSRLETKVEDTSRGK
jgi:GntR family transcriptional regulator, transcriptional repressor for pyruvate dehydrogenase complex